MYSMNATSYDKYLVHSPFFYYGKNSYGRRHMLGTIYDKGISDSRPDEATYGREANGSANVVRNNNDAAFLLKANC